MLLLGEMSLKHEIGSPQNGQTSIVGVSACFAFTNQCLSVNVILSVFKVFKYIKVDKRMSLIVTTFYKARMTLFSMFIVLMVFLTGFSLAFTLGFGSRIYGFRNFKTAFLTLIKAIFDEFPHSEELNSANSFLGPGLQLLFQGFINFCLVSLMIAIIEDAFSLAQEELQEEGGDKDALINNLKKQIFGIAHHTKGNTKKLFQFAANRIRRGSLIRRHDENDRRNSETEGITEGIDLTDLPTLLTAELSGPLVAHIRESKVNTNTDGKKMKRGSSSNKKHNSKIQRNLDKYHIENEERFDTVHSRMNALENKLDQILTALTGTKTVAV